MKQRVNDLVGRPPAEPGGEPANRSAPIDYADTVHAPLMAAVDREGGLNGPSEG